MNTPSIDSLQRQLADALKKIGALEHQLSVVIRKSNAAINGQTVIIKRLVDHTGCPPASGRTFIFGDGQYDVGREELL